MGDPLTPTVLRLPAPAEGKELARRGRCFDLHANEVGAFCHFSG